MEVLNDKLNDKKEVNSLPDFIKDNFEVCSFDNIASFVKEANDYPTTTFEELFEDMNLSSKGTIKPHSRSCKPSGLKSKKKKDVSDDCCWDCCCAG